MKWDINGRLWRASFAGLFFMWVNKSWPIVSKEHAITFSMNNLATKNISGSLRFLFTAISALLFFIGENISLRGIGGLFNSGNLPYFASGLFVTLLGCVIYLHFVCRRSLLESVAISLPLLVFSVAFSILILLRIINGILDLTQPMDILRGVNQSGSFSIGVINALVVNCLALSNNMPIIPKLVRLIAAIVVSIVLILVIEAILVVPSRAMIEGNNDIEAWYIGIYTVASWLITTFLIFYRNPSIHKI
jgi:hypothetical protein